MSVSDFANARREVVGPYPLPPLITFAGKQASDVAQETVCRRAARIKNKKSPQQLEAIWDFARAMARKSLYDVNLISTGDVRTYLSTLAPSSATAYASLLSDLFHQLRKNGIVANNSFIFPYTVYEALAKHAPWALFFARRSGPDFERALINFVEENRREDNDMAYRLAEVENVARWMIAEEVQSWAKVTAEHIGRYHSVGLRDRPKSMQYGHFEFAISFVRFLLRQGLVSAEFGAFLRPFHRIPPPPPMTDEETLLLSRFNTLQTPSELPQDFTLLNIGALPFRSACLLPRRFCSLKRSSP